MNERVVELNSLNQDLTEIENWSKTFDPTNIPVVISKYLENFCIKNYQRQNNLNSQIRHLKRKIKQKVISISSKL